MSYQIRVLKAKAGFLMTVGAILIGMLTISSCQKNKIPPTQEQQFDFSKTIKVYDLEGVDYVEILVSARSMGLLDHFDSTTVGIFPITSNLPPAYREPYNFVVPSSFDETGEFSGPIIANLEIIAENISEQMIAYALSYKDIPDGLLQGQQPWIAITSPNDFVKVSGNCCTNDNFVKIQAKETEDDSWHTISIAADLDLKQCIKAGQHESSQIRILYLADKRTGLLFTNRIETYAEWVD